MDKAIRRTPKAHNTRLGTPCRAALPCPITGQVLPREEMEVVFVSCLGPQVVAKDRNAAVRALIGAGIYVQRV